MNGLLTEPLIDRLLSDIRCINFAGTVYDSEMLLQRMNDALTTLAVE